MNLDLVAFVFVILFCVIFIVLMVGGPGAFYWLFHMRKRIDEMAEQNAKLEATLRRLQQDIHTNRTGTPPSGIITLEPDESPFQEPPPEPKAPVQPVQIRPAVPVVPFAVAPKPVTPPSKPIVEKNEKSDAQSASAKTNRFGDSGVVPPSQIITPPTSLAKKAVPPVNDDSGAALELFIGQKLFGWVAVGLVIIAAALFIKMAIDYGWITDTLKVAGLTVFGAALLGIGFYARRTGLRRFSTMMSSAGIIVIYQAGYASYAFYHLISSTTAGVVMPVIVAGGFLLAWFYRSKLLGTVAIVGGLAVPILVSTSTDKHIELFIYLMSLNVGTLILVNLLRRAPIAWIAFFGTQALFWMWYPSYQADNLTAVLLFQSAFYIVFLADTAIAALRPIGKKLIPTWDDAMRAVLAPIIFFGAIFIIGEHTWHLSTESPKVKPFFYEHIGIVAFIMAGWYVVLALLYSRLYHLAGTPAEKPEYRLNRAVYWQAAPSAATVIAFGFVAIGIPLQFSAMWITLGWLTVFAGLWYFGHRQANKAFVVMAYIFFGLGITRFLIEIADQLSGVQNYFTPLFNSTALPMLASASMLIVAAVLTSRFVNESRERSNAQRPDQPVTNPVAPLRYAPGFHDSRLSFNHIFGHLGYFLLGVILSGEAARYLYGHPEIWQPYSVQYLLSAFLLGFWFALAVLLLEIGAVFRSKTVMSVAFCGLVLMVTAMVFVGFPQRSEYQEAFNNPFSIILIAGSLILLLLGYQSSFFTERKSSQQEKNIFGGFGVAGLFMLIAILTVEWVHYFEPSAGSHPTARSITLLWTLYALYWIGLGFIARNLPIRICGLIVLFLALAKTTFIDSSASFGYCSWQRGVEYSLENWTLLINPYFLTMLCPVIPTLLFAAVTNRGKTIVESGERIAWKVAGILGLIALLIYLSVECYQFFDAVQAKYWVQYKSFLGVAALTVQWTVFALILTFLALYFRSKTLRIISMLILVIAVLFVLLGLDYRPAFTVPFWNPYAAPMYLLAAMVLALGYFWASRLGEEDTTERNFYRFFAFFGVFFLWLTMSVECFRSVRLLAGAADEAWRAQMALSILWSVFAGVLIAVGFIWRSSILRWMAILLFGTTLLKIFLVDMSGVHDLYRFGAVFALACLLAAAAGAYQRFKPG